MVGVHFLGFGKLFTPMFYWVGVAFVGAAVAGTVAGLVSGARGDVEATTGLLAAASLFAAAAWGISPAASRAP